MKRDLLNVTKRQEVLDLKTYTADATTGDGEGTNVDGKNVDSLILSLVVGNYTDGTHDFTVEHAHDDGTGSPDTWEAVPSSDIDGSFPAVDASGDSGIHTVGVRTDRRFVRVITSLSGTSSGATYGVYAVMDNLRYDQAGRNPATN